MRASPQQRRPDSLRVAFFSDALPERNGAGAYYHDLMKHLKPNVAACRIFQPLPERRFSAATMKLPGDATQEVAMPAWRRIRQAMDELRPHVVVSVTPGLFGQLGKRLAHRHHAGLISAYHTDFAALAAIYWGPIRRRLSNRVIDGLNRRLFRESATVLVNNSELVDCVRALDARRVDVMGTPIDRTLLDTPPPPPPNGPEPVVFAGRLAAEKNIDAVLTAAQQRPGQSFIIAGDGPQRDRVIQASRELANLDYRGWLSRPMLLELFDEAGLVVLPSHVETFGSVALEAMARGRPVLVAASAGIHDWPQVAPGVYKLGIDEPLADALARLNQNAAADCAAGAEAGRQAALQLHRQTIDQWLTVLSGHAGATEP